MLCSKCGMNNHPESKFCIGCGNLLGNINVNTIPNSQNQINQTSVMQNSINQNADIVQSVGIVQNVNQTSNGNSYEKGNTSSNMFIKDYFLILISILLKPFTTLKEKETKWNILKNSFAYSLFLAILATILKIFETIWSLVRVRSYDYTTRKYVTKWVFENIKEVNLIKEIGQNFLIYLGIILAIAVVFYMACLIIKKQPNFSKILGISAMSVTPLFVCMFILSPIVSMISSDLATFSIIAGGIYSFILLYEAINQAIVLDGNAKYYFNLVCLSVLGIAAYYVYMKFIGSAMDNLGDIWDFFK